MDGVKPGLRTQGPATCLVESSGIVREDLRDWLREMSHVCVEPEHRGMGYGRALMDAVLLEADEAGVTLFVSVDPYDDGPMDQAALRAWYERNGFVEFQASPLLMARTPQRLGADNQSRIVVAH